MPVTDIAQPLQVALGRREYAPCPGNRFYDARRDGVAPVSLTDFLEIIGEIMKSICEQILAKMKYLGVIVKEPLFRRASVDDYSLCFDYFSRKTANSQNLIQGSSFGLSLGNYGVFTNNVELRNLNQ